MRTFFIQVIRCLGLKKLYVFLSSFLFGIVFFLVKSNKRRVIFQSYDGKFITDSPLALYQELAKKEEYEFCWVIRKSRQKNIIKGIGGNKVTYVKYRTFRYFFELARSGWIFSNSRLPYFFKKKTDQVYIQCWHGTPLKKIGCDIGNDTNFLVSEFSIQLAYFTESRNIDYFVSPSPYATEKFRSSFMLESHKVLELGYPRNDLLCTHAYDSAYIKSIKKELGLRLNSRVVLYAPTYRDHAVDPDGRYYISNLLDSPSFISKFTSDVTFLVRGHYYSSLDDKSKHFIDVSEYNNISDLYLISDALVTDYSSVFFDYSLLNRPIYFYMPDLEFYENSVRGFYLNVPSDLPGKVFFDGSELAQQIINDNFLSVCHQSFNDIYNPYEDGCSSHRIIEYLIENDGLNTNE